MKYNHYFRQIQKIPKDKTKVLWYLEEFQDDKNHPWEIYINQLFLRFNILLPKLPEESDKKLLIGLTVLVSIYELVQGRTAGTYRILVDEIGFLDEIEDVNNYLVNTLAKLINFYYQANEKNELNKLEADISKKIERWNWHPWVKQEEVMFFLGYALLNSTNKTLIDIRDIPQVLSDYQDRIDRKRLDNLDRFLKKSEKILNSSTVIREQAIFFIKILHEIENGGENLKSGIDILPQYNGTKLN